METKPQVSSFHPPIGWGNGNQETYALTIQALNKKGWPDAAYRLRGLLRVMLRTFGFRVSICPEREV